MDHKEFVVVMRASIARSVAVLDNKAKEYASDGDRLSNFKKAAAIDGETPERALKGMLKKHWISIAEMIEDLEAGQDWPREIWLEKITDGINYLYLLEGLLAERYKWGPSSESPAELAPRV